MSDSRTWRGRSVAALAASAVLIALGTAPAQARASAPTTVVTEFKYYEAVVNLLPDGPSGFTGSVSFRSVVGGVVSVSVNVTQATTVICGAGGQDIASLTIATDGFEATEPGPVTLDIDGRLRTAHGDAVVDLIKTQSPGCGAPETTTLLPARVVSLDVTGTSVRFRTGINSTISTGPDRNTSRVYDLSRDGTGSVSVGSILQADSDFAFLKYAVEHHRTRGTTAEPPANAAPAGGTGAQGAFTTVYEPAGGLGVVFDDVSVTASTSAPPKRLSTIDAVAVRDTMVACPGGGTAVVEVALFGSGPGSVTIDSKLSVARVSGTVEATRFVFNGCDPGSEPVQGVVMIPVSMNLTATGPAVRVKDTFFQVTPGLGNDRTRAAYIARDAAGTVTVANLSGATGLASISKAAN